MARFQSAVSKAATTRSGQFFAVRQSLTSSSIATTAKNLTTVATGRLKIVDIMVNTDATGLAGGTNFVIARKTAATGATNIISDAISGLGANVSHSAANVTAGNQPSVTNNVPTVLESGDILVYSSTVANCTGAGVAVVTIILQRIDNNASLVSTGA